VVFDSIKENYFHSAFEVWKKIIGSLFWRRCHTKLSKLSQHFFFDQVQELSSSTSYSQLLLFHHWYTRISDFVLCFLLPMCNIG
jgi:hypothetical protein